MPSVDVAWPLVGREHALEAIARVRDGGCGVVIVAEAGAGKSRLAREACAAAELDGAYAEWVQATRSAAAVPLGAFAGLLSEEGIGAGPLELMQGAAERLRERAGERPVILGVDDAHSLDEVSAAWCCTWRARRPRS
jgi:hypothetical protein